MGSISASNWIQRFTDPFTKTTSTICLLRIGVTINMTSTVGGRLSGTRVGSLHALSSELHLMLEGMTEIAPILQMQHSGLYSAENTKIPLRQAFHREISAYSSESKDHILQT